MTRHERIVFLLENYMDVENGLQEPRSGEGDFVPQMCRAYRHPSYVELRRLMLILQSSEPVLWWNLAEQYFRYQERRVTICPRCSREYPPAAEGMLHKHGPKTVTLVPRVIRKTSLAIRPELVQQAVRWIETRFQGEPFIPDELLVFAA